MNKCYLFIAIIASNICYAGSGSASDGELALVIIIAILVLPVAALYFIRFLKHRISDFIIRKMLEKHSVDHNGEI